MSKENNTPIVLSMIKHDKIFNHINAYAQGKSTHYDIMHAHTFHEFSFLVSGSLINNSNNRHIKLNKNDLLINRPDCAHQLLLDKNSDYILFNIEINNDFLKTLLSTLNGIDIDKIFTTPMAILHCSNTEAFEITQLFYMAQKQKNVESKQFYLKLLLIKYLTKFIVSMQNSAPNTINTNTDIINVMLKELNTIDNFTLSSKEICNKQNYSQEYIIRIFKSANLDTPNKIFLKNKLSYAATLLATSDIKILNIAELCGIYTISYFNKAFKKEFGDTPMQYRKKHQ